MEEWVKVSINLITIVGGLTALQGTFDLLLYNCRDGKDWKGIAFKTFGGMAVLGLGLLLRYLVVG